MQESGPLLTARVQQVLDKGFQKCLKEGKNMQVKLESEFQGQIELIYTRPDQVKEVLAPHINEFYNAMAETIFKALRTLQAEPFENNKPVNFFFLPGYHSHLINRRIFYQMPSTDLSERSYRNFGVGLCGDPDADVQRYQDCSHSKWYHHATTPPPSKGFLPASPYHWFAYQQPRVSADPYNLIASLTFTTSPSVEDPNSPEHKLLYLDGSATNSRDWGRNVADMLNSLQHVHNKDWEFPDRGDQALNPEYDFGREPELRDVRCLLISLWMHSVFRDNQPDWWDHLIAELKKQRLDSVLASIDAARNDPIASDWGDGNKRPLFVTWTTIGLHPLVAPPPMPITGSREHGVGVHEASDLYRHTIGWATLLCSEPLGVPFISVVRQWIWTVYSMLRSGEVSILLRDREPSVRAAQSVRSLSHDIKKFMEEPIRTLLDEVDQSTQDAIEFRLFVLRALRALGALLYGASSAAPDPAKLKELKHDIVTPLVQVGEQLAATLYCVASDVQGYRIEKGKGRVAIPSTSVRSSQIPVDAYVSCYILIGELVRNYCRHSPRGAVARLSVESGGGKLNINLEGPIEGNPVGPSFALLENMLDALFLGKADHKNTDRGCRWTVTINLEEEESKNETTKVALSPSR